LDVILFCLLTLLLLKAVQDAERKAREDEERKVQEAADLKLKEEEELKAAESTNSATEEVRASLEKDTPQGTFKLLNSFTVENGPAQRMSYLMEVPSALLVKDNINPYTSPGDRSCGAYLKPLRTTLLPGTEAVLPALEKTRGG
jgi:hypothetical protein